MYKEKPQNECITTVVSPIINMPSEICSNASLVQCPVLLQTALVQVVDKNGVAQLCRALLDSASQSNFISEQFSNRLGLQKLELPATVTGIGEAELQLKFRCKLSVHALKAAFQTELSCLVIPKISGTYPSYPIDTERLVIPKHINLADPGFGTPGEIDILIGGAAYLGLLCIGQFSLGTGMPTLQKTRFGWVIGGELRGGFNTNNIVFRSTCHFVGNVDIQDQLAKFWEVEEVQQREKFLSAEEKQCEDIFEKSVYHDDDGRFVVQIPFKKPPSSLGDSRQRAVRRFRALEVKLAKNPVLRERYVSFMQEYQDLSRMVEVPADKVEVSPSFYFPHHCVINDQSPTTKLRVVFDGSAISESGDSLNSIQFVGPTLQEDELFQIILRFRQHNIVICADIVKMYRQILIEPSQLPLQRILWRSDPSQELKTHELRTVTYGTASAPYIAKRCLKQLALESNLTHPEASRVIENDFYMDDLISGSESVNGASYSIV